MEQKEQIVEEKKSKKMNKAEDLFYYEYKWKSVKDDITYYFKIRLNTNNTISFSCLYIGTNHEKNNFEKFFSLIDFSTYKRFKKNEDIKDIYIYLLTMIQENQYTFNENNFELELIIKPYTSYEKNLEFILPKLIPSSKCEVCGRSLNGINYLRYLRNNNNYNFSANNTDINNTVSNDEIQNKAVIEKILEEIETLKKENCIKNEQIKNLQKDYFDQNQKLFNENQALKNQLNKYKKNEINTEPFLLNNTTKTEMNNNKISNSSNYNPFIITPVNKANKPIKFLLKRNISTTEIFNSDPNNLKYHSSIVKNTSAKGVNNIFEVFTSNKDGQKYLVSKNAKTHNIEIISLTDNQIIKELSYENNTNCSITMIKYFFNYKNKNEYLVAADTSKNVIIWDISNDYQILHMIKTEYIDNNIYSCYLFLENIDNYIITSCGLNRYKKNETSYTKIYSMKDGKFIKNIIDSNDNNTYYLLIWHNEIDKIYYLVELCEKKIVITNFMQNQLYATLNQPELKILKYYSGYICTIKNKKNYLCCTSSNGYIVIWDLVAKELFKYIKMGKFELYNIIPWSKKYALVSGGNTKLIKIIDMEDFSVVNSINTTHHTNVNCIKKINHPKYGESLLSCGNDHKIKLYILNDKNNDKKDVEG